jgi:hypothetical protein
MGELTKQCGFGKQSPGPIYQYQEDIKYVQVSIIQYFKKKTLYYRNLIGVLERQKGLESINLNMISTRMLSSLMILVRLILLENQESKHPKSAQSQE